MLSPVYVVINFQTPKKIYSGLNDADYAAMIQANGIHNGGRIMIREPMIKVPESFYDQANKYFRRISLTVIPAQMYVFHWLESGRLSSHHWTFPCERNRAR